MIAWRCRHVGLAFVVLFALARSAHATIDMTGQWYVGSDVWTVTQTGTALTQTPPSAGQFLGPRTGTIDPIIGSFTLTDPGPCQPPGGAQCSISGTVAPDGQTFTATANCLVAGAFTCDQPIMFDLMGSRTPPACGNGTVDAGEDCDGGACCDAGCHFVAKGVRCGAPVPHFCDDTRMCDGAGACVQPTCRATTVAGSGRLALSARSGALRWTWAKGQATAVADFGDPLHVDNYTLCVFDDSGPTPSVLLEDGIPAVFTRWRATGTNGFRYRTTLAPGTNGVKRATLKAGADGLAKVTVTTDDGPNLPALPLSLPVRVQLFGHDDCWGATFDAGGVRRNTATSFSGKSTP